MVNTNIYFLNAAQDFQLSILEKIKAEALNALTHIRKHLPEINLDLVFLSAPKITGGEPIWGYSRNASTIFIYIDLVNSELDSILSHQLKTVLAHEYHHACRWKSVGYGSTLGEVLISEGLADIFSMEVFNGDTPRWCKALNVDEIDTWLRKASEQFNDRNYNHQGWFFGNSAGIPKWTGYSLGYFLVNQYLAKNPHFTASQIVNTPANTILETFQNEAG